MDRDPYVVRTVAVTLCVIAIVFTVGFLFLAARELAIPDALLALGSAAIGAVSAFLVSANAGSSSTARRPAEGPKS